MLEDKKMQERGSKGKLSPTPVTGLLLGKPYSCFTHRLLPSVCFYSHDIPVDTVFYQKPSTRCFKSTLKKEVRLPSCPCSVLSRCQIETTDSGSFQSISLWKSVIILKQILMMKLQVRAAVWAYSNANYSEILMLKLKW